MMNGFEPPADYGASTAAKSDLPFIPPPDYLKTIKYAQQPKGLNGQQVIVPRPPVIQEIFWSYCRLLYS
jgi:hypothetical protein